MTQVNHYSPIVAFDSSAVISASATTSSEVNLQGTTLCGVFIPATFDGANISFQVASSSGGAFYDMRDVYNNAITAQITDGDYVALDPALFAGVQFIKIVSDATETAERTIGLATRAL